MLFHNQTFEERLKFFELNLCDFPKELTGEKIEHKDSEQVIAGLKELQKLFEDIYAAVEMFKEEDPLESLHNVTNTIMFLYSAGIVGELNKEGEKWFLKLDKKQMKTNYKQSFTKPMENLLNFGFYFEYLKNGSVVQAIAKCTEFTMYCEDFNNIPLALSYIMKNTELNLTNDDYGRMQGLFYKLDYRSMFLKESTKKEDIEPLRADIENTAGEKGEILEGLLKKILSNYPLKTKIKLHEYYTPHWMVQFYTKSKNKYVFNVNVAAETICLEIRLSSETIEALAEIKNELSEELRGELHKRGCISCNNQCQNQNLKESNGVSYCTAYSEARLIMLYINSEEDASAALKILNLESNLY